MLQAMGGWLTCNKSSKSRAASFFMSETLFGKFRMAESDEPKDGT